MVSTLTSSVVDCGFEPQLGQVIRSKATELLFVASLLGTGIKEHEQRLVGSQSGYYVRVELLSVS
jgi:hypothetical protein